MELEKRLTDMIDISNAKWDFSKEEKYVIDWFNRNGFDGEIIKQYVSKTIFEISKNGATDRFELPQDLKNVGRYMEQFGRNWEILCELQQLRKVKEENNMNETIKRAQEIIKNSEWDTVIPELEVGEEVEMNDLWDGNGEVPEDSYSYQLDDNNWIDYRFEVIEKAENPLDIKIKITAIELV